METNSTQMKSVLSEQKLAHEQNKASSRALVQLAEQLLEKAFSTTATLVGVLDPEPIQASRAAVQPYFGAACTGAGSGLADRDSAP